MKKRCHWVRISRRLAAVVCSTGHARNGEPAGLFGCRGAGYPAITIAPIANSGRQIRNRASRPIRFRPRDRPLSPLPELLPLFFLLHASHPHKSHSANHRLGPVKAACFLAGKRTGSARVQYEASRYTRRLCSLWVAPWKLSRIL